jgi:hypothetical protein
MAMMGQQQGGQKRRAMEPAPLGPSVQRRMPTMPEATASGFPGMSHVPPPPIVTSPFAMKPQGHPVSVGGAGLLGSDREEGAGVAGVEGRSREITGDLRVMMVMGTGRRRGGGG